jgi:hypothetical protein
MKTYAGIFAILLFASIAYAQTKSLDVLGWPRDIKLQKGSITIYQPQIEKYADNRVDARAAIAYKVTSKSPVFGAMWFTSRVVTDKDSRLVVFDQIVVETMKFPEGDEAKVKNLKDNITESLNGHSLTMDLDRFLASIKHLEEGSITADQYKNDPPKIFYESSPSVLVFIDGEPIIKDVENSSYKYVMNTPFFLVQDSSDKNFYLKGGKWWYISRAVESGWKSIENPPKGVVELSQKAFQGEDNAVDSATINLTSPPKIIVSTEPAELIQTDGEPKFEPVQGTDLLFLSNSESDIIMDIQSQQYYILISGRWYTSKDLKGMKWSFISPEDLPANFAKIPEQSDISDVRYSVPGTQEAQDAMLENSIPQTAEVDRKTATVEVKYDGNPKFKKIESNAVSYAENSDKTVLLINNKYYCVDNAIWFMSAKASGPWEVCVEVPEEVQDIPPSEPVYNVKYVYVYDYTPDVVYVGYTPGYYGSYVYYGTVIYGTGYWYRPWYGAYYYPRPVTYGFNVHYNPWTGWGFSVGMSYGWISYGWHPYYGGWWGPSGYRYGYRHGYYHGYGHGYNHGYWHGYADGRRAGNSISHYQNGTRITQGNVYRNRENGVISSGTRPSRQPANTGSRVSTRPSTSDVRPSTRPSTTETRPSTRPANPSVTTRPSTSGENNVYSDRDGNVYRRDNNGSWEQRTNGQWNSQPNSRPSTGSSGNLNRDYSSRQQGTQRANTYNNRMGSESSGSGTRSTPRSGRGRRF